MTKAETISISLSRSLTQFIESYKIAKGCESDSQVIEVALKLLRRLELESAYLEASLENDPDWDVTVADGLTDETW